MLRKLATDNCAQGLPVCLRRRHSVARISCRTQHQGRHQGLAPEDPGRRGTILKKVRGRSQLLEQRRRHVEAQLAGHHLRHHLSLHA